MKTFEALVYVTQGNAKIPRKTHVRAGSSLAAQDLLEAQYGRENLISVLREVSAGTGDQKTLSLNN